MNSFKTLSLLLLSFYFFFWSPFFLSFYLSFFHTSLTLSISLCHFVCLSLSLCVLLSILLCMSCLPFLLRLSDSFFLSHFSVTTLYLMYPFTDYSIGKKSISAGEQNSLKASTETWTWGSIKQNKKECSGIKTIVQRFL